MRFCGVNGCTKFPDHAGEHDPSQRSTVLEPRLYAEESVRADRITPEVIGRRVLITTTANASLSAEVDGYTITAERTHLHTFERSIGYTSTSVEFKLVGVENTVSVAGDSEVKVLA